MSFGFIYHLLYKQTEENNNMSNNYVSCKSNTPSTIIHNKYEHLNYYCHGAISGMFGVILSHPIDTIKTHIQTGNSLKSFNFTVPNLYKGLVAPLIGVAFEKAIVFGTYNYCLKKFNINNTNEPTYAIPLAGGIAGLSASMIVSPYERLKILKQHSTTITELTTKFLYKGFFATVTREMPGFAIYFSVYENLKYYTFTKYNKKISYINSFIYGGISGCSAWIFIYPQDRIKTILQSNNTLHNKHTFITVMADIYSKGGIKYFYKGFSYAVLRAMFLHSGTFCMMEFIQNF